MQQLGYEKILNYPITTASKNECVERIYGWVIGEQKLKYFVCANPHSVQIAEHDEVFQQALKNADLVTPDGVGIVIASKVLGGEITGRITGSEIFLGLNKRLNENNTGKYFFLGSSDKTLSKIQNKMAVEFPNIEVVGTYSPPYRHKFSDTETKKMVEIINAAAPDVLWVGMTAPKQEKWIYEHKDELNVRFVGAIGAVFDFYVGNIKRSHPVFQKMGLEWLPRLLQEPTRLWRRNFISNPLFSIRVVKQYLKQDKN